MKKLAELGRSPVSTLRRHLRAPARLVAGIAGLLCCGAPLTWAQSTWNIGAGGSWNNAANWNPAGVPTGAGVSVTFNGQATGSNPAQTANRSIALDGGQSVGSLLFNTDLSTFTNSIATGSGGPLTFDGLNSDPVIVTTSGAGTGNNTISVAMSLADLLVANVTNVTATSAAGSLNLTGTMSGPGGFVKAGDGVATVGTGLKTYLGPTSVVGGRFRISQLAQPSQTSSFTIESGGQVNLITNNSTYTFGAGPLNLNGAGPLSGPFAVFPGAIRNDTNLVVTIANSVVLQTDTLIHVQGATSGLLTLSGSISGTGMLTLTAPGSNADLGRLSLGGDNSYSGGTLVRGGMLIISSASADFGTGDVAILSGNSMFTGASASLQISTGVLNAIADTATLSLAGGGAFGVADDGYASLQGGINEVVGGLTLGGVPQPFGTYGSSTSGATFTNDEYFSGTGIITVVPEPGTAALVIGGLGSLLGMQRRRRGC